MKFLLGTLLLGFISISCLAQKRNRLDYTIAPWFNNKKAAVTLTFDDGLHGQYYIALPLIVQYGFKSTFFVTVNTINSKVKNWDVVNNAVLAGNEVGNHCLTHPHFKNMPPDSIALESTVSNKLINGHIPTQKVITLAYPFGEGGGNTVKDEQIRQTITKLYIGARATQNKPYPFNKYEFAKTNNDYYKINSVMIADSATMNDFGKYIDQTIAEGGWFCPTYHGIADGWIITPEVVFKKHLNELKQREAEVWIAPFKNVLQYHKERNCSKLTSVSLTAKRWQLALTDTLSNRQNYNQPLTINLSTNGKKIKSITQKGQAIAFIRDSRKVVFNALPGSENIFIQF